MPVLIIPVLEAEIFPLAIKLYFYLISDSSRYLSSLTSS
jgi:hypothetical protein